MWPNPQETTDLVTFTVEIFNVILLFSDFDEVAWSIEKKIMQSIS